MFAVDRPRDQWRVGCRSPHGACPSPEEMLTRSGHASWGTRGARQPGIGDRLWGVEARSWSSVGVDTHRFSSVPWWSDPTLRARVQRMSREAAEGRRRPLQVLTCTAGGPHLLSVTQTVIDYVVRSGLDEARCDARPVLRWLIVERGTTPEVAAMARALEAHGIEVHHECAPARAGSSIADGRRALVEASSRLDLSDVPIVLVLDDDLGFDALLSGASGMCAGAPWPWFHAVWAFHEAHPDVDVGLGDVTGAPPVPASSTLATNLRDLEHAVLGLPGRGDAARWSELDYYYDLAESPVDPRAHTAPPGWHADDARLLDALMVHGMLFRSVVATPTTVARERRDRVVRGGNTIMFHPRWLERSHPLPRLGALRLRRGDTIWVQAAISLHHCRVRHFPFPLHHFRDGASWSSSGPRAWQERLIGDLGGAGVYRGLERWRRRRRWIRVDQVVDAGSEVREEILRRRARVARALERAVAVSRRNVSRVPVLEEVAAVAGEGLDAIGAFELRPESVDELLRTLGQSLHGEQGSS